MTDKTNDPDMELLALAVRILHCAAYVVIQLAPYPSFLQLLQAGTLRKLA